MLSPAIVELGKSVVLEYIYLRTELGALCPGLTSVRVVERARPDWAADDVRVIAVAGSIAAREKAGGEWLVAGSTGYWTVEDLNRAFLWPEDAVRVVARFEQVQP